MKAEGRPRLFSTEQGSEIWFPQRPGKLTKYHIYYESHVESIYTSLKKLKFPLIRPLA